MLYALPKRKFPSSGVRPDDPNPACLECEQSLSQLTESEWFCCRCYKRGLPLPVERDPTPPRPTAAARMAKRWNLPPSSPDGLKVPLETSEWPIFFEAYFPHGLWLMSAHDDSAHTIPDDSFLYLCVAVWVEDSDGGRVNLALPQPAYGATPMHLLRNTVSMSELSPGILVLGNHKNQYVRLDAHLSSEDLHSVGSQR